MSAATRPFPVRWGAAGKGFTRGGGWTTRLREPVHSRGNALREWTGLVVTFQYGNDWTQGISIEYVLSPGLISTVRSVVFGSRYLAGRFDIEVIMTRIGPTRAGRIK